MLGRLNQGAAVWLSPEPMASRPPRPWPPRSSWPGLRSDGDLRHHTRDGAKAAGAGNGNAFLVEACEFRQNFLHLHPHDAVILNIEPDHFDCYDSREALEAAFARFAACCRPVAA